MNWDRSPDFAELYDAHIRHIYAYCLRRTTPSDAQDAAADVFIVVWRRWADRPNDAEVVPWIYGIARNVLANRNRAIRRQLRLTQKLIGLRSVADVSPEPAIVQRAEHDELLDALSKLSPVDQETLRLVEWEGLGREQVAGMFGVTRAAIDQRISRAYRRLAHLLRADLAPTMAPTGTREESR